MFIPTLQNTPLSEATFLSMLPSERLGSLRMLLVIALLNPSITEDDDYRPSVAAGSMFPNQGHLSRVAKVGCSELATFVAYEDGLVVRLVAGSFHLSFPLAWL